MFMSYAPIINEMEYIDRYLKSVFSVTCLDYCFLMDGGSDDGTVEFIKNHGEYGKRLVLFQHPWDYYDTAIVKNQRNRILTSIDNFIIENGLEDTIGENWLLQLDSDEQFSGELLKFINMEEYKQGGYDAFAIPTLNHYSTTHKYQYHDATSKKFMWIDDNQENKEWVLENYPDYHVRLLKYINGELQCFNKDLHGMIEGYKNLSYLGRDKYIFHSKTHNRWHESGKYYQQIQNMRDGKELESFSFHGKDLYSKER